MMLLTILLAFVILVGGVLCLCAWTAPTSPFVLRWLRGKLWFISVGRWWQRKVVAGWKGHRWGRSSSYAGACASGDERIWGGFLLGLEIGSRGGTRRNVRHAMRLDPCPHAPFGPGAGCWMCQRQAPPLTRAGLSSAHLDGARYMQQPDYEGGEMKVAAELATGRPGCATPALCGGCGSGCGGRAAAAERPDRDCITTPDGGCIAPTCSLHDMKPANTPAPGPAVALPPGLKHVRDLEAFDGPLLSEFTDASGAVWVLKWAARGDEAHRWLMVRSTRESIACYLAGIFSMCDLLAEEGDAAMLVDYDGVQPRGAWSVSLSDPKILPYLPERDVMHDPELRPEMVS